MIHRRTRFSIAIVILVLLLLGGAIYLRKEAPPEAARLLPESDGIVYLNLRPLRSATHFDQHPVAHSPEYQRFIDATGIQFERDLDEVAMSRRDTPDGRDTESAEVFLGRFDEQRLRNFLDSISTQRDSYHGRILYVIPHEGHTVRVCLLGSRRVAVTNMASSDAMHEIIDAAENSPTGPSLLQAYYQHVPAASLAWLLVRTGSGSQAQMLTGWSFDFLENTVTIGSVRYEGDLRLRADVIAATDNAAKQVVDSAGAFLSMYRTVAQSVGAHGNDPDVKAAIESIQVAQNTNVAVFTATLSQRFLKKVVSEAGSQAAAPTASPSPTPTPERKHRRHRRHKPMARPTPPAG
jgi:hypothetical protein